MNNEKITQHEQQDVTYTTLSAETHRDGARWSHRAHSGVNRAGLAGSPSITRGSNMKEKKGGGGTCTDTSLSHSLASPVSPCHLFERQKAGEEETRLLCACVCVCVCVHVRVC